MSSRAPASLPAKPRLAWVDAGKGLSIVLVVFYHAGFLLQQVGLEDPALFALNEALADLRMPTFFLLSGLFAGKWIEGGWRALIEAKLLLFAWVYVLWTLLELPAKWTSMAAISGETGPGALLRQGISLLLSPVRAPGPIWFIWALLLFFIAAKAIRRWPLWVQLTLAAGASLAWRLLPESLNDELVDVTGLGWRGILLHFVFFLVGVRFAGTLKSRVSGISYPAALGILVGWAVLWGTTLVTDTHRVGIVAFVMSFAGLAAGLALAVLLQSWRPIRWVGERTLPIYVAHYSILIFLAILARELPAIQGIGVPALAVTLTVVAVALSLALDALRRFRAVRYLFEVPPPVRSWMARQLLAIEARADNARRSPDLGAVVVGEGGDPRQTGPAAPGTRSSDT